MISLIICSRTENISPALQANIDATIGIAYQLVIIDNSENYYSIFEAYNIGVSQSHFPYLCFMHDDIEYHTQNWGQKVINHFKDRNTGAIGIAGTPYATEMPGSWWGGGPGFMSILPADESINEPSVSSSYKNKLDRYPVLLLDGVWICIKKEMFKSVRFDNINYKGFHFYDVDISMQVNQAGYKLFAIENILIRHFGKGNINLTWCENALIFNRKWSACFPLSCIDITYNQKCKAEYHTLIEYIGALSANGKSRKEVAKFALTKIVQFKRGYFYYKTPAYLLKFLYSFLQN